MIMPPGSGEPRPQPDERAQTHRQFGQGNEHAEGHRHMAERPDEPVDGASSRRPGQLCLDGRRIRRREEAGIGEFLKARKTERETQEGTQG
jgi:hypothetical protein